VEFEVEDQLGGGTSMKRLAGKRVLFVDDERDIREILSATLHQLGGATMVQAENGIQALATYQASHFDCVVTDLTMPAMKGDELARQIRAINPKQRIVMVSGFAAHVMQNGRLPEFIDVLLSKPCLLEDLMNAIDPPTDGRELH
jgi:CheY-like chemotaxis protein